MYRTGFVSPYLFAKITENHTHTEWSISFYITAAVLTIGAVVFLIFAKADVQNFDSAQTEPSTETNHSLLTAPSITPTLDKNESENS